MSTSVPRPVETCCSQCDGIFTGPCLSVETWCNGCNGFFSGACPRH